MTSNILVVDSRIETSLLWKEDYTSNMYEKSSFKRYTNDKEILSLYRVYAILVYAVINSAEIKIDYL